MPCILVENHNPPSILRTWLAAPTIHHRGRYSQEVHRRCYWNLLRRISSLLGRKVSLGNARQPGASEIHPAKLHLFHGQHQGGPMVGRFDLLLPALFIYPLHNRHAPVMEHRPPIHLQVWRTGLCVDLGYLCSHWFGVLAVLGQVYEQR